MQKAVINMNNLPREKYGAKPEEIEKNLLISEVYKKSSTFIDRREFPANRFVKKDKTKKYAREKNLS